MGKNDDYSLYSTSDDYSINSEDYAEPEQVATTTAAHPFTEGSIRFQPDLGSEQGPPQPFTDEGSERAPSRPIPVDEGAEHVCHGGCRMVSLEQACHNATVGKYNNVLKV